MSKSVPIKGVEIFQKIFNDERLKDIERVSINGYYWMQDKYGQCDVPEPNTGFVDMKVGRYHSTSLKLDGSIVVWGSNGNYQHEVPEPNSDFIAISAKMNRSLGLKSDGTVVAWEKETDRNTRVPEPNSHFIGIAAGWEQSLALRSAATLEVIIEPQEAVEAGAQWRWQAKRLVW